ncbi:MAG: ATP synthase F1 subunit gamma [Lachnospiraceae bacterium]
MASAKEILTRIYSIRDTMKITSAMHRISSAKLKKAKKMLDAADDHFFAMQESVDRILHQLPDLSDRYFGTDTPEEKKRVGYLVVTADKGLAGAYNQDVEKRVQKELDADPKAELFVIGEVGRHFFEKKGYKIHRHFQYTAQNPSIHRARVIAEEMLVRYDEGRLDELYMVYTHSKNGLESEAKMVKLLPFSHNEEATQPQEEITCYQPSPKEVLDAIVPNYVTGYIYGALVESFMCEQNDRMMAMKAATDNATAMLHNLYIAYNRVRQTSITQEITEVIAGAKAQKRKKSNG